MAYITSLAFFMALFSLETNDDKEFATKLYYSYRGLFYKVATKYFSPNHAEVEDAISNAIVAMCTYLATIRKIPEERIPAYMLSIIRNVCLKRLAKIRDERKVFSKVSIVDIDNYVSSDEQVEDIIFAKVNATVLLDSYCNHLSETDRELIHMRHVDMMSIVDIAHVLGKNEGAVRTALSRAKKRLENTARKLDGGE